jgi:aspartyl-tRNA(Asn)/glutamyl-tRNA(Gln) amidotransferase subunit A
LQVAKLTLTKAVELIQSGGVRPSELVSEFLDRVDKYDGVYKTFTLLMREEAERAARKLDALPIKDVNRLKLYGVPLAIKDIYDVRGVPTTAGTTVLPNRDAKEDAVAVGSLRKAGAVLLGKLNLHEIALGITSVNPHFGTVRNPWDVRCIAGGSSGGSGAAIAASFCLGSLGTDTGGSIRIPASLTGVVGLKPTYGLIGKKGMIPLSWSMDHAGPMAKTVKDVALLMEVLTGRKYPIDYIGTKKIRIGVPKEFFWDFLHRDVKRNLEVSMKQLEKIGFTVEDDVRIPCAAQARNVLLFIILSEAATYYDGVLSDEGKRRQLGKDVLPRLEQGRMILATQYLKAQRLRRVYIRRILREVFSKYDLMVTPTTSVPAPRIEARELQLKGETIDITTALTRCTAMFNLTGFPAISIPNGFTTTGLPTGMQVSARPFGESLILQVAHSYESRTKWHEKRSPELRTSI